MSLLSSILEATMQGVAAAAVALGGASEPPVNNQQPAAVTFPAEATVKVRDVHFQGNRALPCAELQQALDGLDLVRQANAACRRVTECYQRAGFPAAQVRCEVQWFLGSDEVRVVFTVEEGER